jgi:CRISPR type I-E-associated protein CasB/Cse2
MTPTQRFISTLQGLKKGDLGRLKQLAGLPLDESVDGFDLFAGLWWPLRERNQRAPRREVAWLVAKLFAFCPLPHVQGATLATILGKAGPVDERLQEKFDELLALPLSNIEPALQWAVALVAQESAGLDWVRLTDALSIWERESTRLRWAEEYMQMTR